MHPVLFHLGPLTIYSYGFLVALAFMIGTLWVSRRAEKAGENVDLYLQAIFWIIVMGFVGARLMYVLYYPQPYLENPVKILLDRGGLVWYGGLMSAVVASIVFARIKKISIPKFGDILLPPVALGLAIGRIGCFMTGCCYGKETTSPLGVHFPAGHETYPHAVHPTQLYESALLLLFLVLLQWVYKHSKTPGATMSLFFIGAGVIRFIIEMFRGDGIYWVGHVLTASQVISLAGILAGTILFFIFNQRSKATSQAVSA